MQLVQALLLVHTGSYVTLQDVHSVTPKRVAEVESGVADPYILVVHNSPIALAARIEEGRTPATCQEFEYSYVDGYHWTSIDAARRFSVTLIDRAGVSTSSNVDQVIQQMLPYQPRGIHAVLAGLSIDPATMLASAASISGLEDISIDASLSVIEESLGTYRLQGMAAAPTLRSLTLVPVRGARGPIGDDLQILLDDIALSAPQIGTLRIGSIATMTVHHWNSLGKLQRLEHIVVSSDALVDGTVGQLRDGAGFSVTDADLSYLCGDRGLADLDLRGCRLAPGAFGTIFYDAAHIQAVRLTQVPIVDGSHVSDIAQLPNISEVAFRDCGMLSDATFAELSRARTLRRVSVIGCRGITASFITILTQLPRLQYVVLRRGPALDAAAMAALARSGQLSYLELGQECISDANDIAAFADTPHLACVVLDGATIRQADHNALIRLLSNKSLKLIGVINRPSTLSIETLKSLAGACQVVDVGPVACYEDMLMRHYGHWNALHWQQ